MIYLIDDKKERQENDYNWSFDRLNNYKDILKPIYNLNELQENRIQFFRGAKVILYHESFVDKSILSDEASQKRKELTEYAQKEGKHLVYFSGGSDTRQLEGNVAYISDATLYQNLEFFLKAYQNNNINLEYLVYGSDPKLEQKLKDRQLELIKEIENEEIKEIKGIHNLFLRPLDDFISNPILNSDIETLWEASDEYLNKFIKGKLQEKQYDNIFIPLCFGDTLSDFNGFKLAIYIRCSKILNQFTNVFIYGFVRFSFLINHRYFNVLKTKNVKLIGFSKEDIYNAVSSKKDKLTSIELPKEISKIKLPPPKDYYDNHSIANEWAIHRWSKTINVSDDRIEIIENKIEENLYFKYLKAVYPINKTNVISDDKLRINYSGEPKVLYIDDEVEKGWGEIFADLFEDKNNIYLDWLIEDFKNITQDKLIDNAIKKIVRDDIDLVLLDFRLLPRDFSEVNIKEITGVKLLRRIKKLNPGIQVIIFSATNKVWNLQKLQEFGADFFILKEAPDNSIVADFTKISVQKMLLAINECFERSFLKEFYIKIEELKADLLPRKNFKRVANPLDANFVDEVLKWLELSCQLISININKASNTSAFLLLFSVLENLSNQIVSTQPIKINNRSEKHFEFEFSRLSQRLSEFKCDKETGFYTKTNHYLKTSSPSIPWAQKILNTLDYLNSCLEIELNLNEVIGKRNDIIHANSTLHGKLEVSNLEIISLFNTVYKGLKKI